MSKTELLHKWDDVHVDEEKHLKRQIKWLQRYESDLEQIKKEEKIRGELTDGRRRWLKAEIEDVRGEKEKILEEVVG
ncbi:MAG: hypothetical protein ABEJ69_02805 [Candidatus Nanohaloarchaea archaeon]